ncbi:MAG: GEVED domain-containing protein [Flavobacteriales bacterium]
MKYIYLSVLLLISQHFFAQYCTNVGPTSTVDSNVESVVLNGVVGSINYTGCPGIVGLQDLTQNVNVTLNAGTTYTISVKFGTCNGNYAGVGEAWLDFDQNGNFDPYESLGTWAGTPPAPVQVWSFTVPPNAVNGVTRLRVMQREAGTLPLNPCSTYQWGSVTDFGITLANGLDCTGYPGDAMNDAITVGSLPYSDSRSTEICYSNQNFVYPSADIYYYFEPNPLLAEVRVSLCESSFDTFLSVVDMNGQVIAYNDDAPLCAPNSELVFDPSNLGPLYIIVEGWGGTTGDYTLNIDATYVGVDELLGSTFQLYPNPSMGQLHVKEGSGQYFIQDLQGKMVFQFDSQSGSIQNLAHLAPGTYFVIQLQTSAIQKWQKL